MTASSPWVRTTRAPAPTSQSFSVVSGGTTASSSTTAAGCREGASRPACLHVGVDPRRCRVHETLTPSRIHCVTLNRGGPALAPRLQVPAPGGHDVSSRLRAQADPASCRRFGEAAAPPPQPAEILALARRGGTPRGGLLELDLGDLPVSSPRRCPRRRPSRCARSGRSRTGCATTPDRMLTARWAASCSSAKARRLSPSQQRGVTGDHHDGAAPVTLQRLEATRTAWPVPSWVSWTASTASGHQLLDVRADLLPLVADDRDDPVRLDGRDGGTGRGRSCCARRSGAAPSWSWVSAGCRRRRRDDHGEVVHGAQLARPTLVGRLPAGRHGDRVGWGADGGGLAPRVGVEPTSLVLIQSQAGPAGRPTGE